MDGHFFEEFTNFCTNLKVYDDVKLINGKFGKVCVVKHKPTNKLLVRKTIDQKYYRPIEPMVHHLMKDNKYFVNLFYSISTLKSTVLILDYIPDGDLFEYVKSNGFMNESETRSIVRQTASALNSLHGYNIIHNDIKLENILYTHLKRIIVCDYGLCKIKGTESEQDGTLDYYSPEKIKMYDYEESMDWWALGIMTYELATAHHPFKVDKDEILDVEVLSKRISKRFLPIRKVSDKMNSFVNQMLNPAYKHRLRRYSDVVNHPFVNVI
ncbi:PK-1 [Alphabaculovirus altermyunipunctae]|jgi:serine/threonine protein kinase|uniref:non-specific serine/threonine protein kinase n=1 Tax=Mythimna unipuncta nucleopolyhedrovirus TaxID=447897 RepID=A0A346TPE0_9ABAC|nr:PK-1 [Mythimna unipuncta nucleopolyhedrovirus]AXU41450.1 PK-1 [Mythimna unipuncta nucleopolyhedrovirus]